MKKIFTLFAASLVCAGAFAQTVEYGIYTDLSKAGKIRGIKNADDDKDFGIKTDEDGIVKVTHVDGETVKAYMKLNEENNADREQDFNGGRIFYQGVAMTVSDPILLYCSGFRDGTSSTDCTITSDNDATSRFPESEDFENKDNGDGTFDTGYWFGKETDLQPMSNKTDMAAQNPGYWTGVQIEVPAGKQINVENISVKVAAGNAFWWCVNIYNEAGTAIYKSGTACMQFSNGDKNTENYWIGGSAEISKEGIIEPEGGKIYGDGKRVDEDHANYDILTLPIDAAKANKFEEAQGSKFGAGKTPLYNFQPLPEGLALPAGKNTVRLYFGKRNSRLFCPVQLLVSGTLGEETAIETLASAKQEAVSYNLAGQQSNAKGLCVKGGKVILVK